jgi:hypothetical protein
MTDPNTLIGAGLAAFASKEIITKLLGPTADYIGGEMRNLVQKCNINLNDIFLKACRKLGKRIDEPGIVNPRILRCILDDGGFCEDDLTKEYFAGVLASSRTSEGKDDRGVTNAKLISNLSSFQIRTHYVFYTMLRKAFGPHSSVVFPGTDRYMMFIYIPTDIYYSAMGILDDYPDHDGRISILSHSMNGIRRNDLIEDNFTYGGPEFFRQDPVRYRFPEHPLNEDILCNHGITFQPTPGGMELYLWAHGLGRYTHFQFLDPKLEINEVIGVRFPNKIEILYEEFIKSRYQKR